MQESPVQPFDDPALKAALCRSLDKETAPASLRDRIKKLAAQNAPESAPQPTLKITPAQDNKPIPMFRRSPLYRFAVAAVLIIGFGGLGYQIWQMNQPTEYDRANVFTAALYQSMLDAHTARKSAPTPDSITTFAAAPTLSAQLKRPLFAADLAKDGWTFQGGAVGAGADQAAQLFFTKGKAAISVFSLPATVVPNAREGESYDTIYNNAQIAGFTRSGGLFCIVGTSDEGPLKADEIKQMLEAHKGEIVKG